MSIRKYFGMLALTMALATGCSGADSNTDPTANEQQALGGFWSPNGWTYNYTDTSISYPTYNGFVSNSPIRGINVLNGYTRTLPRSQHTYWYVMDSTNDGAALIDSMSYCGSPVSPYQWNTVTVNQGYFYVQLFTNGATQAPTQVYTPNGIVSAFSCRGPLSMHVGAPYSGTIQITPTGLTTPGKIYSAVFVADGGQIVPQPMDPITTLDYSGNPITTNGYLVPIPGIEWNLQTGNTTQVSSAITFANSNDAVGACVSWGYDPVANSTLHQTCTRMKRADFCGNGQSWTDPAGPNSAITVQLWDNGGTVHANPGMPINFVEALWTPSGATCVNQNVLRVGPGNPLIQYNSNATSYGQYFNASTTCGYALPPCTSFSTTWNMASSDTCQTWDSTGTQCLMLTPHKIQ